MPQKSEVKIEVTTSRGKTGPVVQRRAKTRQVVTRRGAFGGARPDASRPVPMHVCTAART